MAQTPISGADQSVTVMPDHPGRRREEPLEGSDMDKWRNAIIRSMARVVTGGAALVVGIGVVANGWKW